MRKSIIRIKRRVKFTTVSNAILNNTELSWAAKGLLVFLLSRPDGWQFYEAEISKHSKNGRRTTHAAMKELIQAGYVSRQKVRGEKGQFSGWEYQVCEEPLLLKSQSLIVVHSPRSENRSLGEGDTPLFDKYLEAVRERQREAN